MASGRTISASQLTPKDEKIIQLCEEISKSVENMLTGEQKKRFKDEYGKISFTRDGGAGRGAGKLQRDALCTRGIQGKAPFSNRNLRWHPLVIATNEHNNYAKTINRIEILGDTGQETLVFYVNENGNEVGYPADIVHKLTERYVTLPCHWEPLLAQVKNWNDTQWTQNSCIIPAYEACDWPAAVEAYAVLAISIAVDTFELNFDSIYNAIVDILKNQQIDKDITLPSEKFPEDKDDIISCPLCKLPKSQPPANQAPRKREERYKFAFSGNKRDEGDDSSLQIMHIEPLGESELKHSGANVRYGHRWCNIAMTDHSIDETVDFMEYIVKIAHKR